MGAKLKFAQSKMLSQIEKKPGTECKRAPFGAPSGAAPKSGIFQKSEWCVTEWFRAVLALGACFFFEFSQNFASIKFQKTLHFTT